MADSRATPYIIPFFITHAGCPHQCVFCNQRTISGAGQPVTSEQIHQEITQVLLRPRDAQRRVQVAFYGGSFTGLDVAQQRQLLEPVQPFLVSGAVQDIRLSTRPDCLDRKGVQLLLEYGVTMVELGVQSLDAEVLLASGRGHTEQDVVDAFNLLQDCGMRVGGQLMVGLPADTPQKSIQSCTKLIRLKPECVRIYPTLVMKDTGLAALYQAGAFQPWSLDKTVVVVARMKGLLDEAAIGVIRMGLQAGGSLHDNMMAGPYHPAFGELVLSRLFMKVVRRAIFAARGHGEQGVQLIISARDHSLLMGMKKENLHRLQRGGWLVNVEVCPAESQPRFQVRVNLL